MTLQIDVKCVRCYKNFIVDSNIMQSLMIAATHCPDCTIALSKTFRKATA